MKKFWIGLLAASLALTSCIKLAPEAATNAPPPFVTSTLPPTKPGLSLPTATPASSTPDTSTTTTPGTAGATESAGSSAACTDSAVMIEDVTIPDNTIMTAGAKFTKTWRFLNNGKCNWNG